MGVERNVIEVMHRQGWRANDAPRYRFHYAALEIGDWFTLKGSAQKRAFRSSLNGNQAAKSLSFKSDPAGERSLRITRIA